MRRFLALLVLLAGFASAASADTPGEVAVGGALRDATMDPAKRTLLKVEIVEDAETGAAVESLMGNKPEERFRFITERAEFAKALDI